MRTARFARLDTWETKMKHMINVQATALVQSASLKPTYVW
jgi:hypothetical protein